MGARLLFVIAISVVLAAPAASAHRVNILALPEGDGIQGYVYYADGNPVANATVQVQDANSQTLGSVETDAEGAFKYQPSSEGALTFVVETADGHRAETTVDGNASVAPPDAADTPAAASASRDELTAIVREQLTPLRKQLDAYQHEIRLHDILGGIGYIVGILGVVAWWKARQGRRP